MGSNTNINYYYPYIDILYFLTISKLGWCLTGKTEGYVWVLKALVPLYGLGHSIPV